MATITKSTYEYEQIQVVSESATEALTELVKWMQRMQQFKDNYKPNTFITVEHIVVEFNGNDWVATLYYTKQVV